MITKTDGSLRKADVRYLEARLVELAKQSPLAVVENGKNPAPPQPTEAHKVDLDSFLVDVRRRGPVRRAGQRAQAWERRKR